MNGRVSFSPPWRAQPSSLAGRRPGPAPASAALAAATLRALLVVAVPKPVSAVLVATGATPTGDSKPTPAVLLPNGVRNPPGNATVPLGAKFPETTVFGSNWPPWISCTAPDSWAEPQGWSRRRAPTKSGTPLRCTTSSRRATVGRPVTGSKVTPTGETACGLPMNTLAPLPLKPWLGIIPAAPRVVPPATRPVDRPNTPPWLNTGLRRKIGSSIEIVAERPPARLAG